mgnify:CR=1 FL=1
MPVIAETRLKMYLILDEYDNFANNVLVNYGNTRYRSLTHGDGFLRNFLKPSKTILTGLWNVCTSPVSAL